MKEFLNDIHTGALPPAEWAGYLTYLITHNLGKLSIALVIGAVIAWALAH